MSAKEVFGIFVSQAEVDLDDPNAEVSLLRVETSKRAAIRALGALYLTECIFLEISKEDAVSALEALYESIETEDLNMMYEVGDVCFFAAPVPEEIVAKLASTA